MLPPKHFLPLLTIAAGMMGSPAKAGLLSPPIVNPANGHTYYLTTALNWTAAEAEAVTMGGHLVTISDAAESVWVYNQFAKYQGVERIYWIGLYQPNGSTEPGSGWRWVSGEPLGYTNWMNFEPNNNTSNGVQNWGMVWPSSGGGKVGGNYAVTKWNDYWDSDVTLDPPLASLNWKLHGVIEIPAVPAISVTRTSEGILLSWNSKVNRTYQVQTSQDLGTWPDLGSPLTGTGAVMTFPATFSPARRYYRLKVD